MTDGVADPPAKAPKRPRMLRTLWRKVRAPLARSRRVKSVLAMSIAGGLRAIHWSNRLVEGSSQFGPTIGAHAPVIVALWHGQHLLTPCFWPRDRRLIAMFSRSADAELNAQVFEKLGFTAVRGSGGREGGARGEKGGARALLTLKKALDSGESVAMIADIQGAAREAGLGIALLARISGRPVMPSASITSRRRVLARTWDKTTINLPFGRMAILTGEPIYVPAGASDEELEEKRREITRAMNEVTAQAYRLVDGQP